jgi:hypothetical protein
VVNDAYSDAFSRLRRRKTLSLAAELQWELLPPMSFGTDRVVVTGGLEPAYDVGGNSIDLSHRPGGIRVPRGKKRRSAAARVRAPVRALDAIRRDPPRRGGREDHRPSPPPVDHRLRRRRPAGLC